jgi:4-diphosphocytidyl-2-C-methyl-D-erythritol kinase
MHTVELGDDLHIRLRDGVGIHVECNDPSLPTDGRNLVVRAAGLVLDRARVAAGLRIGLVKRVPVSAGLGGGSSDAAATIVGLNRLLGLGWSAVDMARAGQTLGSDVPFFFFGPAAFASSRGEDVVPLVVTGQRWVVLVNPGFPIQTRWAYDRLAATRSVIRPLSEAMRDIASRARVSWDAVVPLMENDFEDALAPTHPVLAQIRSTLLAKGADGAMLSGSGATVFGVFREEFVALRARDMIAREFGWWTSAARAGSLVSQEENPHPLHVG